MDNTNNTANTANTEAAPARTSGELPHRSQRLWAMRKRAKEVAEPLFNKSAAKMLSQENRDRLWQALLLCFRDITEQHMDNNAPNTPFPYQTAVPRAISTVISDNLELFRVTQDNGEAADDSLPSELI